MVTLNKEYLNEDDRRTIYMHDFFMYGMYSEQYNRFTLAYLLVMEAVLEPRHKWTLLDGNTYYWHIKAYHIYIWGRLGGKIFGCKFSWIKKLMMV